MIRMMLDTINEDILYFLKKGRTNAYQVWTGMISESNGENVLAYKNIWERFQYLSRSGIIQQIKINHKQINKHGKKDYQLSKKGKQLIRQRINRLEEIVK